MHKQSILALAVAAVVGAFATGANAKEFRLPEGVYPRTVLPVICKAEDGKKIVAAAPKGAKISSEEAKTACPAGTSLHAVAPLGSYAGTLEFDKDGHGKMVGPKVVGAPMSYLVVRDGALVVEPFASDLTPVGWIRLRVGDTTWVYVHGRPEGFR